MDTIKQLEAEHTRLGERRRQIDDTLFRATLPESYQPLPSPFARKDLRIELSGQQIARLRTERKLVEYKLAATTVEIHRLRFGVVPQWASEWLAKSARLVGSK